MVGKSCSVYLYDRNGLLVRLLKVDGAVQEDVPFAPPALIPYLKPYHVWSAHQWEWSFYDTLGKELCWPHMANAEFWPYWIAVRVPRKELGSVIKRNCDYFLSFGPLNLMALDIIGPLPKASFGNQYAFVYIERYTKLKWAIPVTKVDGNYAGSVFVDHWVVLCSAPITLLSDKEPQLASQIFTAVFGYLWVRNVLETAYHP